MTMMMMNSHPRPITDYTVDEVEAIVLKAIRDQGLTPGYYYDAATNQSLRIHHIDIEFMYSITYVNGFYNHTFYTDTLTLKNATA